MKLHDDITLIFQSAMKKNIDCFEGIFIIISEFRKTNIYHSKALTFKLF